MSRIRPEPGRGMAVPSECPRCGRPGLRRNGSRRIKVSSVGPAGVTWDDVEVERLSCRSCARSVDLCDADAEAASAEVRAGLADRLALHGLAAAAGWGDLDPRTVSAWVEREVAPTLSGPFPAEVALAAHHDLVTACDAATGDVLDAVAADADDVSDLLMRRGDGVTAIRIGVDQRLREAAARGCPGAATSLLDGECLGRLDGFLAAAAGPRRIPEAALLADRVRTASWTPGALSTFEAMTRAGNLKAASTFLAFWGAEILSTLSRPRGGAGLDIRLPRSSPDRVRAILHRSRATGIGLSGLRAILEQRTSAETQP